MIINALTIPKLLGDKNLAKIIVVTNCVMKANNDEKVNAEKPEIILFLIDKLV